MRHFKFMRLAAVAAITIPTFAVAVPPDNLRVYSVLTENVNLSIDGSKSELMPAHSVNLYYIDPGMHSFSLTTTSGTSESFSADFSDNHMATSRGKRWWCVLARVRSADQVLVFNVLTQQQCQVVLGMAPGLDEPRDDPEAR